MKLLMRIWNALKLFAWAFQHYQVLREHNFKCMSDLFMLILKVSEENRPYVTHLAFVHPQLGQLPVASIWIGAGEGADPIKRIQELSAENHKLKEAQKWRDDWENAIGKNILVLGSKGKIAFKEDCPELNIMHWKISCKFKIVEP